MLEKAEIKGVLRHIERVMRERAGYRHNGGTVPNMIPVFKTIQLPNGPEIGPETRPIIHKGKRHSVYVGIDYIRTFLNQDIFQMLKELQ